MRKLISSLGVLAVVMVAVALLSRPAPLPIKSLDPWILQSNDPNNPHGTYLANGYIGAKIGPTGTAFNDSRPLPTLMAGLYDNESLVHLPDWSPMELYGPFGKTFELDVKAPYRQTLNMREGWVETELTLKSRWQRLSGSVTTFVLRNEAPEAGELKAGLIVVRYTLVPKWSGRVRLGSLNLGSIPKGWDRSRTMPDGSQVISTSKGGGAALAVAADVGSETGAELVQVRRGVPLVITKYIAASSRVTGWEGDPSQNALQALKIARDTGFEKLFNEHKRAWRDLWNADIVIDGDPEAQQTVRALMFYLLSSAGRGPWSVQPLGLSSSEYWGGHIFWDADIWMYPALLLQHPDFARSMVDYRFKTLPGAKENARKRGLVGAEYAWESASTGLETAPEPYNNERHITSDVALAQWQYYLATQDKKWLTEHGWPVIKSAADYWLARSKYSSDQDRYEILQVVPPDENAEIVNNSVYTNTAARLNLEIATRAADVLGVPPDPEWANVASKMYIPFDPKENRYVEFDGYDGQTTKQADVELMIYPLCATMPDSVRANTFDYYKERAHKNGPAMTSSIHAIVAAELDRPEEAYGHFVNSYKPFLRGPFLMFNEKQSQTWDNTCFVTGCGGALQSALYGFAGLRIGQQPDGFAEILPELYIKPCLPPKWKSIEVRNIRWQGKNYDLVVKQKGWRLRGR
ncbi:MAG: glycoside hydrolase family 65 protein [Armatimonadetes bacterium]|nr:glycoside hydrolase family 65 protein [Armatimonadota bacterium]